MKYTTLIFTLCLFGQLFGQKSENNLDLEIFGHNGAYSLGLGSKFMLKDSSKLGFRIGLGIAPAHSRNTYVILDTSGTTVLNSVTVAFIPSLKFIYQPKKILRGKSTFSIGTTFYMQIEEKGRHPFFNTAINELVVENSFHVGFAYNLLKKKAKSYLNIGVDMILFYRDLTPGSSEDFFPMPSLSYGLKF